MIAIFATICLGIACHEELVTSSRQDPTVNMQWCGNAAPPALAEWMTQWPGYRLASWRCQLGERPTRT